MRWMPSAAVLLKMGFIRDTEIAPLSWVTLALALLILPLRWLLAVILAASFHEFCHILAVKLCGGKLETFFIGEAGAVIGANDLSRGKELICILAGPLGSLLLLLAAGYFPLVAACALAQSAYNLLPLSSLDGGRALRCISALLFAPKTASRICLVTHWVCAGVLFALAMVAGFGFGIWWSPVIFAAAAISGKIPCKRADFAVQ